eukprot:SAG31_NODE_1155_length_9624_cov_3.380157_3_plen_65_part_00
MAPGNPFEPKLMSRTRATHQLAKVARWPARLASVLMKSGHKTPAAGYRTPESMTSRIRFRNLNQ